MIYKITNHEHTAKISSLGAELKSLKDEIQGEEYIWQGNPEIWKGSAPILFPIVGRLKNGQYQLNDKAYQMGTHGFARTATFSLLQDREDEKSFILQSSPATELVYPFKFELEVNFKIEKKSLRVSYIVRNMGKGEMYFTLGSHPAFALPLEHSTLEDYYIEFELKETLDCYYLKNDLLCEEPIKSFLDNEKIIPLSKKLFDNDALIFKNIKSRKVSIQNKKNGQRVLMDTGQAPHFGIWAKPNAPYVCLEPWYSYDESISSNYDFTNKAGIIPLNHGEEFTAAYRILV